MREIENGINENVENDKIESEPRALSGILEYLRFVGLMRKCELKE